MFVGYILFPTRQNVAEHDANGDGREDPEEYSAKLPAKVDEGGTFNERTGNSQAR